MDGSSGINSEIPITPNVSTPERQDLSPPPEWYTNLINQPEYKQSELSVILQEQAEKGEWNDIRILASDIDGTMTYKLSAAEKTLPEEEQKVIIAEHVASLQDAKARLDRKNIPLIAITGRNIAGIQKGQPDGAAYSSEGLPMFPVCAEAVGTTIQVLQKDGTYREDGEWNTYISEVIGFDRDIIYKGSTQLLQRASLEAPVINLTFQAMDRPENVQAWKDNPDNQGGTNTGEKPQDKKLSFNWEGSKDMVPDVRKMFELMLNGPDVNRPHARIVISHDRELGDGRHRFNVDLVPVTKGDAIEFMGRKYGGGDMSPYHSKPAEDNAIAKPESNTKRGATVIVAGDSGNDEDMIKKATVGIVVGGAKPELKNAIEELKSDPEVNKTTNHFVAIGPSENQSAKLEYIEPTNDKSASRSLNKAVHALELFDALRTRATSPSSQ